MRVWVPFPFDSICEHMLHQQEFIFKAPNVWNRPASFARQTLLSIYHQAALLCYLFKRIKNCDICRHFKFCCELINHNDERYLPPHYYHVKVMISHSVKSWILYELKTKPYLIFVFFFTLAKFLENKINTKKRQFFALNL